MIVSWAGRLQETVERIVIALANRLTAADNFGPEGTKGFILTSNGEGPDDPPPSYQSLGDIINLIPPGSVPGLQGPPGPAGPAGANGANGMVPLVIGVGETFTVPENRQAVFSEPIDILGNLVIDGALTMVD